MSYSADTSTDTVGARLKPVSSVQPEDGGRRYIQLGPVRLPLIIANMIFLITAIGGQVGQNVSLPLWLGSASVNSSDQVASNVTEYETLTIDAYFVYSFACIAFVIIFGVITLLIKLISPQSIGETEKTFPHLQLFLVGFSDALNGVLVVFAAPPDRTKPILQSILGNFTIPMTVAMRFVMLRRRPGLIQGVAAFATVVALFVALMPDIAEMEPDNGPHGASGAGEVLWPMCFMLGFVPAAFMNVLEEKLLKRKRKTARANSEKINLFYFLFWTSVYQLLTAAVLFWVDIVPGYGRADNISDFGHSYWFGLKCFFGHAGCTSDCGARGTAFILCYVLSYIGGGLLLRHAEGATYLAIVGALVTPLGSLFWALFQPEPFDWNPRSSVDLWFALLSLVIMVPAIFVYGYFKPKEEQEEEEEDCGDEKNVAARMSMSPSTVQSQNIWSVRTQHRQATEVSPLLSSGQVN